MKKLLNVLKVEQRVKTTERIIKSKRHDYARGGYKLEETIYRVTTEETFALLECGHWRKEYGSGAVVKTAKRLSCYKCEQAEREKRIAAQEPKP